MTDKAKTKQIQYKHEKAMRRGIEREARGGWHVVSTTHVQPRAGVGRVLALGVFAAVIKPKPYYLVTFSRA